MPNKRTRILTQDAKLKPEKGKGRSEHNALSLQEGYKPMVLVSQYKLDQSQSEPLKRKESKTWWRSVRIVTKNIQLIKYLGTFIDLNIHVYVCMHASPRTNAFMYHSCMLTYPDKLHWGIMQEVESHKVFIICNRGRQWVRASLCVQKNTLH